MTEWWRQQQCKPCKALLPQAMGKALYVWPVATSVQYLVLCIDSVHCTLVHCQYSQHAGPGCTLDLHGFSF